MEKSVALLMTNNYMFDFSKRSLDGIRLVQKPLWKYKYPKIAVRTLRNVWASVPEVFNIQKDEVYDVAIISETEMTGATMHYLARHPIAKQQYVHLWNKVTPRTEYIVKNAKKAGIIVSTYNLQDAKNYGIEYRRQCWNKEWAATPIQTSEYDLVFLGMAKNRYKEIVDVMQKAEKNQLRTRFMIISPNGEPYTTRERVRYSTYIDIVKESKAILDMVGRDNYGLTYRPLEALFMKKKLITNYQEITQYDFYEPNRENIFIVGLDNWDRLREFVNQPFHDTDFSMDEYDIESWLRTFLTT